MYGLMTSPGKLLKKHAPTNAPIAPGNVSLETVYLSTFPNLM